MLFFSSQEKKMAVTDDASTVCSDSCNVEGANPERKNLKSEAWGSQWWTMLHTMAYSMPRGDLSDQEHLAITCFVNSMKDMLPCASCRKHLSEHYANGHSFMGKSGAAFSKWAYDLHQEVKRTLGQTPLPAYGDFLAQYETYACANNNEDLPVPGLPTDVLAPAVLLFICVILICIIGALESCDCPS
jgi:hypothetical protein